MANNNNQLFDAAVVGFLSACLSGRNLISAQQATYTSVANAAAAFATKLDSLIPADGGIITPVTSATLAKVNLLTEIVSSSMAGAFMTSVNPNDYATPAAACAAAYAAGVAVLALP